MTLQKQSQIKNKNTVNGTHGGHSSSNNNTTTTTTTVAKTDTFTATANKNSKDKDNSSSTSFSSVRNKKNNNTNGSNTNSTVKAKKKKGKNMQYNGNASDDAEFEQLLNDLSKITKPENQNAHGSNGTNIKKGDKSTSSRFDYNGGMSTFANSNKNTANVSGHGTSSSNKNDDAATTNDILKALGLKGNVTNHMINSQNTPHTFDTFINSNSDDNDDDDDSDEKLKSLDEGMKKLEEEKKRLMNENEKLLSEKEEMEFRRFELFRKMLDMLRLNRRAFLDTPVTDFKGTTVDENPRFCIGVGEMQGWRSTMEDDHLIDVNFSNDNSSESSDALFGVFDGHSGGDCAKLCRELFPATLKQHKQVTALSAENIKTCDLHDDTTTSLNDKHANTNESDVKSNNEQMKSFTINFQAAFLELDERLRGKLNDGSGCTAVLVHVSKNSITCASVGDSRAVLCRSGAALDLSVDHKPELEEEKARIEAAGGVVHDNRVNGKLAMSRAMGDFEYKSNNLLSPTAQLVTASPRVIIVKREPVGIENDAFIVIACDGIFDVLTNDELVTMILAEKRKCNEDGSMKSNEEICEVICQHCLAPTNPDTLQPARNVGTDNMTIMIIDLL